MSKKKQLRKRNPCRDVLLCTVLAIGMFCFQTKAIGQVKRQDNKNPASQSDGVVVINKNTSEAEIKNYVELLKEHGASLEFSKMERNKQGEIIAIKGKLNDTFGKKSTPITISSNGAIQPIRFYKSDDGGIGFDHLENTLIIKP